MVGVIWYRFVRCGGTDWSDTLVPIRPLQWYRFADIITFGLPMYIPSENDYNNTRKAYYTLCKKDDIFFFKLG